MGMAASQARYLALVARKSNCEYEGQQINQARTALANQSANLFNQMLGLSVPIPPSTQDFTKIQYSFTDGINGTVIDKWDQLANKSSEYNYVVTYHYNADVYTGSQKLMNDPQVQFSQYPPVDVVNQGEEVAKIQEALNDIADKQKAYDEAKAAYDLAASKASNMNVYKNITQYTGISGTNAATLNADGTYTVKGSTFKVYDPDEYGDDDPVKLAVNDLIDNKAITEEDLQKLFVSNDGSYFAFEYDLADLQRTGTGGGTKTILPVYALGTEDTPDEGTPRTVFGMQYELDELQADLITKETELEVAQTYFDTQINSPAYVGNCKLTPLRELTEDQLAEIKQIIKDMNDQNVETDFVRCFSGSTISNDTYNGGIYSFELNGVTYYSTYYDLADSSISGHGINNIDTQDKLPYYRADYVNQKIEKTEKALLETDSEGRFSTVRFENDSITYTLNMETITDDAAYNDAMNQYYYENAKYDKMVQDINAKTSIIQQEDRTLELRLKQLDTEQNALKTEIDAVSKIVKDNVESSFKTFGG